MKLALSTDLYYPEPGTLEERTTRLLELPVDFFELGSRTSPDEVAVLANDLRQAHREIVAVHNYCPVPAALIRSGQVPRFSPGDTIPFSSLDSSDRQAAIAATRVTLE